jgi:hypothetical protein
MRNPKHGPYNRRVSKKSSLEILDVSLADRGRSDSARFHLDAPTPGAHQDSTSLMIVGWVVSRESRPVNVEVVSGDTTVAQAPIDVKRERVAEAYQGAPGAEAAGFRLTIEGEGKGEDELLVRAVLETGSRVPIGTIHAKVLRRKWFHALRGVWSPHPIKY